MNLSKCRLVRWADLLCGGGGGGYFTLAHIYPNFVEGLEDGIMNSVWIFYLFPYFQLLASRSGFFLRISYGIHFCYWCHMQYSFPTIFCVCVCVCACVCIMCLTYLGILVLYTQASKRSVCPA
jgi:hypothetical protein